MIWVPFLLEVLIIHMVVIFEISFVQELWHTSNWWSTVFLLYGVLKFWMLHLQFTSLFHNDRMDVSEYFIGQVSMWFWTNLKLTNPSVTWTSGKRNGEACFCCYYIKKNKIPISCWIDACIINLLPHALCWLLTQIYRVQSGTMHMTNLLAA